MNKYYYLLVAMLATCMVACQPKNTPEPEPEDEAPEYVTNTSKQSQMQVTVGATIISKDTTIVVADAEEDPLSGKVQMGVVGTLTGVADGFRVTVTRSEKDQKDELCAGVSCVPGDGELTQVIDYPLQSGVTTANWYTHYTPAHEGDYKVSYKFQNYSRTLTLTVVYSYNSK